jgi:hypothetical protein
VITFNINAIALQVLLPFFEFPKVSGNVLGMFEYLIVGVHALTQSTGDHT